MALVPMSQTKNFTSATLENEKGNIVFSEEKKKRGPRKKLGEEEEQEGGWKPFELISLYAVHKEIDLDATDFWALVATGMRGKGYVKSEEECRARWEMAMEETKERVRAKEAATTAGNKANKDASPKPSTSSKATRSSPRLKAA